MTGALAMHRRAMIATDDKKAIRLLEQTLSSERILRTSQLVKTWADGGASREEVRRALEHIENRARFVPRRSDPLTEWWDAMLGSAVVTVDREAFRVYRHNQREVLPTVFPPRRSGSQTSA